jgi:hypothetical protein
MEQILEGSEKPGNGALEKAQIDGRSGEHDSRNVEILIKVTHGEERTVVVEIGSRATAILEIFATERGCAVEELVLIREDENEPLSALIVIDADYPRHRRHHLHHAKAVKVIVFYQAGSHDREFRSNGR